MMKCSLLLVPALIVSAGSGTHSAAVADKSVKVTMRNLYPATQPDIDGKRMLRVTDATDDLAGEERAPVGAEGADKLKPLEQLLLHKTTGDHKPGFLESIYLSVADFFAPLLMKPDRTLTMPKNRPSEEVQAAEDPVAKGVDDSVNKKDQVDRSDVKALSSPEDLKRMEEKETKRQAIENFLVLSGLRQMHHLGM